MSRDDEQPFEDDLREERGERFYRLEPAYQNAEGYLVQEVRLVNDPEAECRVIVMGREAMEIAERIADMLNTPEAETLPPAPQVEPSARPNWFRRVLGLIKA